MHMDAVEIPVAKIESSPIGENCIRDATKHMVSKWGVSGPDSKVFGLINNRLIGRNEVCRVEFEANFVRKTFDRFVRIQGNSKPRGV